MPNSSANNLEPSVGSGIRATASSWAKECCPFAALASPPCGKFEELRKEAEERERDGDLRGDEEGGDRKCELVLPKTSLLANDGMVE